MTPSICKFNFDYFYAPAYRHARARGSTQNIFFLHFSPNWVNGAKKNPGYFTYKTLDKTLRIFREFPTVVTLSDLAPYIAFEAKL